MATQSQKQQITQQIKDSTNILVTVSANPSVDELSAALGLTVFLNELGKHATAVFSGKVPPAISFLEPDKTFEDTADSLRDFIIALDKEKADHLRYKVVDDAVKIFITPYKTTISEADLEFSQGDYNVELVLALNVENNDHLDAALTAHGRILHDATVATVTAGAVKSNLGTIDWHDAKASSVSEMLVELIDGLKTAKVALSEQSATALLTGIVAATERFSNDLTSSRVMTAAAELMAAGANQQLIAIKLAEGEAAGDEVPEVEDEAVDAAPIDTAAPAEEDDAAVLKIAKDEPKSADKTTDSADGALTIARQRTGDLDEVARQTQSEAQDAAARAAEAQLHKLEAAQPAPVPEPVIDGMPTAPVAEAPAVAPISTPLPTDAVPSFGGTLNATTEQAADDKRREEAADKNKTILKHRSYVGASSPSFGDTPLNAAMGDANEPASVDPFALGPTTPPTETPVAGMPTAAPQKVLQPLGEASSADVMAALTEDTNALTAQQTNAPASLPAPSFEPAPLPVTPTPPPADDAQAALAAANAAIDNAPAAPVADAAPTPTLADIEASVGHGLPAASPTPAVAPNGLPPLPDFSTLPPLPPAPVGVDQSGLPPLPTAPPATPAPFNPSQFQIPGQQ
ncbi:MAG: hypothetical protein Q4A37_02575 [Candidatus Saccharibacteria bacterium]|nr:hypothetical protein [Candidatus Saccharibacteria bacterium]